VLNRDNERRGADGERFAETSETAVARFYVRVLRPLHARDRSRPALLTGD
jgi:hypothetical protein